MSKLTLACEFLGVTEAQVMSYKEYPDHICLVVDMGVKGCPKHTLNYGDLPQLPTPPLAISYYETNAQVEATKGARYLANDKNVDLSLIYAQVHRRVTLNDVKKYLGVK